jgi:energy-converting hydrogenase Eha subunit C
MHLLLLAIGVLVTAVGAVMLAFSVPLTDLAGVALFTSGMIAAVAVLGFVGAYAGKHGFELQRLVPTQVALCGSRSALPWR